MWVAPAFVISVRRGTFQGSVSGPFDFFFFFNLSDVSDVSCRKKNKTFEVRHSKMILFALSLLKRLGSVLLLLLRMRYSLKGSNLRECMLREGQQGMYFICWKRTKSSICPGNQWDKRLLDEKKKTLETSIIIYIHCRNVDTHGQSIPSIKIHSEGIAEANEMFHSSRGDSVETCSDIHGWKM